MIRRLALTAGFAVLGAVAFAPSASAQVADPVQEDVTFEGTVGSTCTLTPGRPGELMPGENNSLDSFTMAEAQSGQLTVNCTGNNQISVTPPSPVTVPDGFTADTLAALVSEAGTEVTSSGTPAAPVTPGSEVLLDVDMVVGSNNPLPPGSYEYTVTVSATPE